MTIAPTTDSNDSDIFGMKDARHWLVWRWFFQFLILEFTSFYKWPFILFWPFFLFMHWSRMGIFLFKFTISHSSCDPFLYQTTWANSLFFALNAFITMIMLFTLPVKVEKWTYGTHRKFFFNSFTSLEPKFLHGYGVWATSCWWPKPFWCLLIFHFYILHLLIAYI